MTRRVVDAEIETIKVYRLVDGTFQRTAELSVESGDSIGTSLLPGLVVMLTSVFELP